MHVAQVKVAKSLKAMTVADVCEWLKTIKMEKYATAFQENEVNGLVLLQLDKAMLADVGVVKPIDQGRILAGIEGLKEAGMSAHVYICVCYCRVVILQLRH